MHLSSLEMNQTENNTSDQECEPSMNPKNIFIALHLLVMLIGIPSNIFFLCVSYQLVRQKNALGVYLFNLALSDLLFILCLPVWIYHSLQDSWPFSQTACVASVFLLFTHFYTSVILLSCIALERYLAIVHPLKFSEIRNRRIAVIVSAAAWLFTAMFNLITVKADNVYEVFFEENSEGYSEELSVCLDLFPLPDTQRPVNMARFVIGFLIPALVVGFCYWRICLDIRKNQTLGAMERQHVCMLLGRISATLYLCFGPAHIMMVLRNYFEECPYPDWLFIGYKFSIFLATLNCLADPLLYGFKSRTGQASASNMLGLIRRTLMKEEEGKMVERNDQSQNHIHI